MRCWLWLTLLLLFTQQGLVLHELGHAVEQVRHAQPEQPDGLDDEHSDGLHRICERCVAYAPIGAAAPATPTKLFLAPAGPHQGAASLRSCRVGGVLVAYHSRAPPRFLV